jgi:hypothetical protein
MAQNKWADKQDRLSAPPGRQWFASGRSTGEGREIAAGGAGRVKLNHTKKWDITGLPQRGNRCDNNFYLVNFFCLV